MAENTSNIFLSVIIPAYDEAERLPHTLKEINEYLSNQGYNSEILVVNDGSSDKTADITKQLEGEIKNLKLIDNKENNGKGWVVKQGMLEARGDIRLFMDADNSTSVDQVERMMPYFKEGYDVVIGSRRVRGAEIAVHQPLHREFVGRVFNFIVRAIGGIEMKDTQAGFKAFSREAAEKIFPKQTIWRFAFDVEILAIARKSGFKVKEVPIRWVNDTNSRVKFKSMIQMLIEVLAVRKNLILGKYKSIQS